MGYLLMFVSKGVKENFGEPSREIFFMTFLKPYQKVVAGLVAVCFLTSLATPPPLASAQPIELEGPSSVAPSFVPM